MWEIAQACAEIKKQKMAEGNMSQGQIDEHLAELIQKDARTVRRYLKLASLDNEPLTKAVHTSEISPTLALDLGKRDLEADEIESLLDHIKVHPKTTRTFERFYNNLEICCQLSGLSVTEVLNCPNSDKFLSLLQNELINRIEYLGDMYKDLTITEILQGKAGSLAKEIAQVKAGLGRALQNQKFQKKNAALVKKVTAAFNNSDIDGQFKIKPVLNSPEKRVSVTITAPENEIWDAIDTISNIKPQFTPERPAKSGKKQKAQSSKSDSPPSKGKRQGACHRWQSNEISGRIRAMNVHELIKELKSQNITLYRHGYRLKWYSPIEFIPTAEINETVKEHWDEIIKRVDGPIPYWIPKGRGTVKLTEGDCLKIMDLLPGNLVDLIVTDPPYGIEFLGNEWDKIVPAVEIWKECLRVLKPGGWAYIMSSPRQDVLARMIINLQTAGFDTQKSSLYWTYKQGFRMQGEISKAIKKKLNRIKKNIDEGMAGGANLS